MCLLIIAKFLTTCVYSLLCLCMSSVLSMLIKWSISFLRKNIIFFSNFQKSNDFSKSKFVSIFRYPSTRVLKVKNIERNSSLFKHGKKEKRERDFSSFKCFNEKITLRVPSTILEPIL